jgi:hypothetical protein
VWPTALDVGFPVIAHANARHAVKPLRIEVLQAPLGTVFINELNRGRMERIIATVEFDIEDVLIDICEPNVKTKVVFR